MKKTKVCSLILELTIFVALFWSLLFLVMNHVQKGEKVNQANPEQKSPSTK